MLEGQCARTPLPPSRPAQPTGDVYCDSNTSTTATGEFDIIDSVTQLDVEVTQNQLARLDTEPLSSTSGLPQRLDQCQNMDSGYSADGVCQTDAPQDNIANGLRNHPTFTGWPSQDSACVVNEDAGCAPLTPQCSPVPLQSQVSALRRPSTDDSQDCASQKRQRTTQHFATRHYYDPVIDCTRGVGVPDPTQLPSTQGELFACTSSVTENEDSAPGANSYMDLLVDCVDYADPRWDSWFRPVDNEEFTQSDARTVANMAAEEM